MLYQIIEKAYENAKYNAGSKARTDAAAILTRLGFTPVEMTPHDEARASAGKLGKYLGHRRAARDWKRAISQMGEGDVAVIQLPLINHTIYIEKAFAAAKARGLRVIGLIHDLEELRAQLDADGGAAAARFVREGEAQRLVSDILIAHGEPMSDFMTDALGVPGDRIVRLEIFDYLLDETVEAPGGDEVVIAGNLKREKAGYVYELPERPEFALYGAGYEEGASRRNVTWQGTFAPDSPGRLSGAWGLVWDGPSADGCKGVYGEYLRFNAPHKASLYLACGLPVIIWKEAALADFVSKNGVGITVGSLGEIAGAIDAVGAEDYARMKRAAAAVGEGLRSGVRLTAALNEALDRLGDTFNN